MRLTCPNCSAQYEVPDEVIPEEGRDVQCSNCEKTWFQSKYPEAAAAPEETEPQHPEPEPTEPEAAQPEMEPAAEPEPVPTPPFPPKPDPDQKDEASSSAHVDPDVASILKEEAEREAQLRAKEAESLETQPDLALEAPPAPDPEQRIKELTRAEAEKDAAQSDDLPDVDAINSSLRSTEAAPAQEEVQPLPRRSSGGFRRGFLIAIIIGVILFLIYGNAQQISEAVPQAKPVLDGYVSVIDQARLWLEAQSGSGGSQN